jgi:hypothetical protein
MNRVEVNPELYRWARDRARIDVPGLEDRFPRLRDWEARTGQLTSLRMYEPPKVELPKPEPLTASCWLK